MFRLAKVLRILIVLLISILSSYTFACFSPSSETRAFFKKIPKELEKRESLAKVKIISTKVEKRRRVTKVKIILAVKGMKKLKTLTVISDGLHSCNRDNWIKQDDELFIAGRIKKNGVFEGTWKGFYHNL